MIVSVSIYIIINTLSVASHHTDCGIYGCEYDCSSSFDCVGDTINAQWIRGYGYKSIYGSNAAIVNSETVDCQGAFSCNNISSIIANDTINCEGSNACANSSIQLITNSNFSRDISCRGSNSGQYTRFESSQKSNVSVKCEGDKSCANSYIEKIVYVLAYGAYSLFNATINSHNAFGDKLYVSLYGYNAAFGAKIICQAGDTCYINCNGNGCHMLYTECIGTCVVNTKSAYTIGPITSIAQFDDSAINLLYDSQNITTNNDVACNTEPGTYMTADDKDERYNDGDIVAISGRLCCRGSGSCESNDKIELQSKTKQDIICSGAFSCSSQSWYIATIDNYHGYIFCEGANSCMYSSINTTKNVYCLGSRACEYGSIYNAQNTYCSGFLSCSLSTIKSSGSGIVFNIYLLGTNSGENTEIHCHHNDTCFIFCGGANSCAKTNLICDGICSVQCDTDNDCPLGWTPNPATFPTSYPTEDTSKNEINFTLPIISVIMGVFVLVVGIVICWYCWHKKMQRRSSKSVEIEYELMK